MRKFALAFCAVLLAAGASATALLADTVVVSNPDSGGALETFPVTVEYTSWTQIGSFSNVSVSAALDGSFPYDEAFSGEAYLTTQIGAGTTTADQVAATSWSVAAGAAPPVTLFTGLNLGPDTYYLIIVDTSGEGGWDLSGSSTTAPGVTTIPDFCELYGTASYPPADSSGNVCGGNMVSFSVVSVSPATGAGVPEPSTFALLAIGLLGLFTIPMLRRAGGRAFASGWN
jgi:PEP-CTERM motif